MALGPYGHAVHGPTFGGTTLSSVQGSFEVCGLLILLCRKHSSLSVRVSLLRTSEDGHSFPGVCCWGIKPLQPSSDHEYLGSWIDLPDEYSKKS